MVCFNEIEENDRFEDQDYDECDRDYSYDQEDSGEIQLSDVNTTKKWFALIEDGVPEDVALSSLEKEAKASDAPNEYLQCLQTYITCSRKENLTEAEHLVIKMYCTDKPKFYHRFNADCRNREWTSYVVYTSLLHSACMKLRNKPVERGEEFYRGVCGQFKGSTYEKFCWPCFTSTTTEEKVAQKFGPTTIVLESRWASPLKGYSPYNEREILFSPFVMFERRREQNEKVYCITPDQSMFFCSFPHFRGALLGGAVANCLGAPYEFKGQSTLDSLIAFVNNLGQKKSLNYTSDTSMTMALAKSLTEAKGFDIINLQKSFVTEYFSDPNRRYGACFTEVMEEHRRQRPVDDPYAPAKKQYGGAGSYGNGSAMRIAPAALFFFKSKKEDFFENVTNITRLTHYNDNAVNGAILQATAVKVALKFAFHGAWNKDIRGEFLDKLIYAMEKVENYSRSAIKEYCEKLKKVKEFISAPPTPTRVKDTLGNGISAKDSVVTAIHCFIRGMMPIPGIPPKFNAYERTVLYAISLGGDTDTIASMAGAIAGAYYGQDAVTQRLRDVCEPKAIEDAKRYSKLLHDRVFN